MFTDLEEFFIGLSLIVVVICVGFYINIKASSYEKQKQYIFDNSNEYTVFNKCEKIYDRYYCKND